MLIKILKKIIIFLFLLSVCIHGIIFFDNVVISKVIKAPICNNEGLFINIGDTACSAVSSYLRPTFYFEKLLCAIKGEGYGEIPLHKGYYCLPNLVPMMSDFDTAPPTNFEIFTQKAKYIISTMADNYFNVSYFPITAALFIIWMLSDAIRRSNSKKTLWILIIIFGYVYGGFLYYFAGRKKDTSLLSYKDIYVKLTNVQKVILFILLSVCIIFISLKIGIQIGREQESTYIFSQKNTIVPILIPTPTSDPDLPPRMEKIITEKAGWKTLYISHFSKPLWLTVQPDWYSKPSNKTANSGFSVGNPTFTFYSDLGKETAVLKLYDQDGGQLIDQALVKKQSDDTYQLIQLTKLCGMVIQNSDGSFYVDNFRLLTEPGWKELLPYVNKTACVEGEKYDSSNSFRVYFISE